MSKQYVHFSIGGMSCRSCEIKIESAWKKISGVREVHVDALRGSARLLCDGPIPERATLAAAIREHGYELLEEEVRTITQPERPSWTQLTLLLIIVLIGGFVLSRFGVLNLTGASASATGFVSAFLIGLLAASSSCLAVSGGLMLSTVTHLSAAGVSRTRRLQPILLFIGGRIASYAVLGAVIGFVGRVLTPSPVVTGAITVLAALYMLVVGLEMLHLAPSWLRRAMPRLPKTVARRVMNAEGHPHPLMAAVLGAGTFFLPCGFTQSLQLAALASGSPIVGATILGGFALGTAPALFALGWASAKLTGKWGTWFFRFSGVMILVLGVWNIQNGLTVAGYPLRLPTLTPAQTATAREENGTQIIDIHVGARGYEPNVFVLKKDRPVQLHLSGQTTGCLSVFVIPKMGLQQQLKPQGQTTVSFTPSQAGNYAFSCGMGMYNGRFTVVAS